MGDACRAVRKLMPWVVNGTATRREQDGCWQHVAGCPACRVEVVQVAALCMRVRRAVEALAPRPAGTERSLVVSALLPTLEALGLPAVATGLLSGMVRLPAEGWTVPNGLPLLATDD
jgi:hypothetical protein